MDFWIGNKAVANIDAIHKQEYLHNQNVLIFERTRSGTDYLQSSCQRVTRTLVAIHQDKMQLTNFRSDK
jgi:hypothetical protein